MIMSDEAKLTCLLPPFRFLSRYLSALEEVATVAATVVDMASIITMERNLEWDGVVERT